MRADLLILCARPWSDGARMGGADAIAVAGSGILAVGPEASLEGLAGPSTRVLDAAGATVTPGLCDAHLHLVAWARARREVRLEGLRSRREVLDAVARHIAAHPGTEPVVGRGWVAEGWEAPPDRASLDAVSGERVVLLHSKDYHALWVNGVALDRAGVTRTTPDPEGGILLRSPAGEPTGVAREHAVLLFQPLEPPPAFDDDLERAREAASILHAEGVTAIHDFEGEHEAGVLRALAGGPGPRLRVLMHVSRAGLDAALSAGIRSGDGDDGFRWGALKLFADGTLGSRTAAVLEPFDDAGGCGLELLAPAELRELVARAYAGGLSVAVHAIGDRAVRNALDAFEANHRVEVRLMPRVEHAQLVHSRDLPRFAALGVAASMQPIHCTSDIPLVERAWATRAAHSYPWRALLESGARLAFGSDAPVEEPRPALGLHAAVTRARADRPGAFMPAQCLTLDQALTAYTEGPARLAGAWPREGRIAPGAVADLVIWNADLHGIPASRLPEACPRYTILEGRVVFEGVETAGPLPATLGRVR